MLPTYTLIVCQIICFSLTLWRFLQYTLGPTERLYFTLRLIVQLLWVNVRLYLTLKVDVIYVKSTHNQLKKWLILKFEFPALGCDWSIQIFDFRYLMAFKNNQSFLISFLYCIDLIKLSQTPFDKDIDMIKVSNMNKQLFHILCIF